jgi:hypothetical protein
MPKQLKPFTDWMRADDGGQLSVGVGVDRENNVLRGFVVAQEGPFKTPGRGAFDLKSLESIVTLMKKSGDLGTRSRFTHPSLSADGLGTFLGRAKSPRIDTVTVQRESGPVQLKAVRADLHFDKTALDVPVGGGKPRGVYVMDLAESDPDALSSSIVVRADREQQLDAKTNKPAVDAQGKPLPPLWRPLAIRASDIVDTGDAVDGLLSAGGLSIEGLSDAIVRKGSALLNEAFPDQPRDVVEARLTAWLDRYLELRYGDAEDDSNDDAPPEPAKASKLATMRRRLELLKLSA